MNLRRIIPPKVQSIHCPVIIVAVIFILVLTNTAHAQEEPIRINTIDTTGINDSLEIKLTPDSLATDSLDIADTTLQTEDSTQKLSLEERLGIKISPDALPSVVSSEAADSAVLDMNNNVYHLYGNAKVKYEDMELAAGKVTYNQSTNMVTASPLTDTVVKLKDRPSFTQGKDKFTYDSLKYNFKSKRAIVRNARTQYGEGYVYSNQIKRNPDQSIYGLYNVYTTCALDTPHFGIRAKKIKVIPGRVVASGPANINIEQVPTPLFLPFGLFPMPQGHRSGFLLPTYTIEENRGLGLIDGGYYFYLNQNADLELRTRLYSKGSWMTSGRSTYANRYHYNGGIAFSYAYNKIGEEFESGATAQKDFLLEWRHTTDDKARPGSKFTANARIGTSSFNANNTYSAQQILNNQYASNITYNKNWANKPFTLSIAARHSQEASTGQVDVTLPEISFFVSQFNPFQGKSATGTKWYEKITMGYTFTGQNRIVFTDSLFNINTLSLADFNNGMKHSIPISASYNVLRFINLTFGANYNEYWLTKQTYKAYDYIGDSVAINTHRGFYAARDYNANISANTRIYGLKMFKKGKLMGIRHVLTPSGSINYTPDFAREPYNFGYETIINPQQGKQYLSPYEGAITGAPSQLGKYSSVVGFGLDNNLQIKLRTNDSAGYKNISIIDRFAFNSGYNLAADSFNWQSISINFATRFFNIINMTANASYDPYVFDYEKGRRINQTMWQKGTGIARFQSAGVTLGGSIKPKTTPDPRRDNDEVKRLMWYGFGNDYVDFNVPWNLTFSYVLQVQKSYVAASKKDTVQLSSHNIGLQGEVNLTPRWKLSINTSYNLVQKQLQLTQIDLYRDLHCWEMRLSAMPFGQNRYYYFQLNVKAQVLQDLKLMRRRDYRDATF